jgi:hypothetical protein
MISLKTFVILLVLSLCYCMNSTKDSDVLLNQNGFNIESVCSNIKSIYLTFFNDIYMLEVSYFLKYYLPFTCLLLLLNLLGLIKKQDKGLSKKEDDEEKLINNNL